MYVTISQHPIQEIADRSYYHEDLQKELRSMLCDYSHIFCRTPSLRGLERRPANFESPQGIGWA